MYKKKLYHSSDIKTLNLKLLFFKGVDPRIFWKSPHLAFLKWGICPRSFPPSLPLTPREELRRRRHPEASFVAVSLRQLFHLAAKKAKPWRFSGWVVGGSFGCNFSSGDLGIILFLDMYIQINIHFVVVSFMQPRKTLMSRHVHVNQQIKCDSSRGSFP